MDWYLIVKTFHIITATVLFGTGMGIAFFMLRSHFTDDLLEKLYASKNTVLADYLFTLPAVILQPLSGAWLIYYVGYDWLDFWLVVTYGLYIFTGLFWIPVVWIQIQLKKMLLIAIETNSPLPDRYKQLFKLWFLMGWPAFISLVIIFYLMVAKPL